VIYFRSVQHWFRRGTFVSFASPFRLRNRTLQLFAGGSLLWRVFCTVVEFDQVHLPDG